MFRKTIHEILNTPSKLLYATEANKMTNRVLEKIEYNVLQEVSNTINEAINQGEFHTVFTFDDCKMRDLIKERLLKMGYMCKSKDADINNAHPRLHIEW